MRFTGQCILVVGASSGIGAATARRLASEGATIVCVGRNKDSLDKMIKCLEGQGHVAYVADAADEASLGELVKIGKALGGYSGGVFCAGSHDVKPLTLVKPEHLSKAFTENVATAINSTKVLAKAVNVNGAGVVWLSSIAAFRGTAGFLTYSAAKGALVSAAKVSAIELAKKKIRVNVIAAGVVKTPMSDAWMGLLSPEQQQQIGENHLLGIGKPEDVADAIAFLISGDARWITGTTLTVDGGLSVR